MDVKWKAAKAGSETAKDNTLRLQNPRITGAKGARAKEGPKK